MNKYFFRKFYIVLCSFALIFARKGPELKINAGKIEGKFIKSRYGKEINAFLGIPYAKPPINDLRFKDPVPIKSWVGVLKAVEDSPICSQRDVFLRSAVIEGQEDCLYLNVYTPQLPKDKKDPLSVMVYIHGGGFLMGSGSSKTYGPEYLLDRDIVLVVFNYRLGPLGFLSTRDAEVPGNMGLKDQNLVLKWIQENIAQFGGDPSKVTIFGQSAGGACVHFHLVSPMSKGLFHRAIAHSGNTITSWALAPKAQAKKQAKKLANGLGCPINNTKIMIDCLQNIDVKDIIDQDKRFYKWDYIPIMPFRPVIEHNHCNAFLKKHPHEIIKAGRTNNVPLIIGTTSSEGAFRASGLWGQPHMLKEHIENFDKILPMSLLYDKASDSNIITEKIKQFYFKGKKFDGSSTQEIVKIYTDGWFIYKTNEAAKMHFTYSTSPTYYYYFDYRGSSSFSVLFGDKQRDYGVCHGDDLLYLFPIVEETFGKKPSENDTKMADVLTEIWSNFAKTGKPTYDRKEIWKPILSDSLEYLHIKNYKDLKMEHSLLEERINFWNALPIKSNIINKKCEL